MSKVTATGASHWAPSGATAPSVIRDAEPRRSCHCQGDLLASRLSVEHAALDACCASAEPGTTAAPPRAASVRSAENLGKPRGILRDIGRRLTASDRGMNGFGRESWGLPVSLRLVPPEPEVRALSEDEWPALRSAVNAIFRPEGGDLTRDTPLLFAACQPREPACDRGHLGGGRCGASTGCARRNHHG